MGAGAGAGADVVAGGGSGATAGPGFPVATGCGVDAEGLGDAGVDPTAPDPLTGVDAVPPAGVLLTAGGEAADVAGAGPPAGAEPAAGADAPAGADDGLADPPARVAVPDGDAADVAAGEDVVDDVVEGLVPADTIDRGCAAGPSVAPVGWDPVSQGGTL